MPAVKWLPAPEPHDYDAAENYLSLLMPFSDALIWRRNLEQHGQAVHYAAKDILRASVLALLPHDNKHVVRDLAKVKCGEALSPILLVRGDLGAHPLVVADGYHRVCASYWIDENTAIPCVITV